MMLIDVRCLIRIRVASRGVLPAPRELDRQEIRGLMEPRGEVEGIGREAGAEWNTREGKESPSLA